MRGKNAKHACHKASIKRLLESKGTRVEKRTALTIDVFHGQDSLCCKLVVDFWDVDASLDPTSLASEIGCASISILCFMSKVQLL